jgi:hypothetical protein
MISLTFHAAKAQGAQEYHNRWRLHRVSRQWPAFTAKDTMNRLDFAGLSH